MASELESDIVAAIMLRLGCEPDLVIVRRSVGSARTDAGNRLTYGTPGEPDIQGWLAPFGFPFFLEVKTKTGSLRETQKAWQRAMERVGVRVHVVRSVAEAERALDEARAARDSILRRPET